jgi:hypothetical protein
MVRDMNLAPRRAKIDAAHPFIGRPADDVCWWG